MQDDTSWCCNKSESFRLKLKRSITTYITTNYPKQWHPRPSKDKLDSTTWSNRARVDVLGQARQLESVSSQVRDQHGRVEAATEGSVEAM